MKALHLQKGFAGILKLVEVLEKQKPQVVHNPSIRIFLYFSSCSSTISPRRVLCHLLSLFHLLVHLLLEIILRQTNKKYSNFSTLARCITMFLPWRAKQTKLDLSQDFFMNNSCMGLLWLQNIKLAKTSKP
jgi:hypothetical protein